MDKDLEEFIAREKRDYGDQNIEKAGLPWLGEVYPERLRHFMSDVQLDAEVCSLTGKTMQLVLLAACLGLHSREGTKVHVQGCLTAGATRREILDVVFLVAAAASHGISVNILSDIKEIVEGADK